jgi:hypothetical protein
MIEFFVYWPIQSVEAGQTEVSLVIGIVACGNSPCPAPSADLGEIVFIGKYQSQGEVGNSTTLNSFENITVTIPTNILGAASIQVQHLFLITPPVSSLLLFYLLFNHVTHSSAKGNTIPGIDYTSVGVQVGPETTSSANIHPRNDDSKCVGILGGTYANGTPVDMYVALPNYCIELTGSLASIVTGPPPRSGNSTAMPLLQLTLLITLSGVLTPVFNLNVRFFFSDDSSLTIY